MKALEPLLPELKAGESIDQLGFHGLRIIQNPAKFKFTLDAFLLAAFIDPKPQHKIIDLGTGGGVLPLLLAGQRKVTSMVGIEIQPELVKMARRSLILNRLEDKIDIREADLRKLPGDSEANSFDYVITNPPFFETNRGMIPGNNSLAMAKFEIHCNLEDVAGAAARCVKANGKVAIIYPTERFNDLLAAFQNRHLIPKRICFIHPRPGEKSNLVLMEARPGAKKGVEVLAPIIVYQEGETYTSNMEQIFHGLSYRDILAQESSLRMDKK